MSRHQTGQSMLVSLVLLLIAAHLLVSLGTSGAFSRRQETLAAESREATARSHVALMRLLYLLGAGEVPEGEVSACLHGMSLELSTCQSCMPDGGGCTEIRVSSQVHTAHGHKREVEWIVDQHRESVGRAPLKFRATLLLTCSEVLTEGCAGWDVTVADWRVP